MLWQHLGLRLVWTLRALFYKKLSPEKDKGKTIWGSSHPWFAIFPLMQDFSHYPYMYINMCDLLVYEITNMGQLHQICTMSLPQRPILDFIKHAIFHSNLLKWSYNH